MFHQDYITVHCLINILYIKYTVSSIDYIQYITSSYTYCSVHCFIKMDAQAHNSTNLSTNGCMTVLYSTVLKNSTSLILIYKLCTHILYCIVNHNISTLYTVHIKTDAIYSLLFHQTKYYSISLFFFEVGKIKKYNHLLDPSYKNNH